MIKMTERTTACPNPPMELLAPAGGARQLTAALRFGADAVYGGLGEYSLRAYADNFTWDSLPAALRETHARGKKFYLTLNLLPFDDDLAGLVQAGQRAFELGVDGALVADPGAFSLLRGQVPGLPLHVSTQANVMNLPGALCWARAGARRIVLARELSLSQIARIRAGLPREVELEVFVHGAMCMAWSGRCMLSDLMTGRSANRGACAQPCRWLYHLTEDKRPDEILDVIQDGRGSSFFSSFDLNMIAHLPELRDAGVSSLKIEGRMKTAIYTASVVRCYREALDTLYNRGEAAYREALPGWEEELQKVSHREYGTGFYFGPAQSGAGPVRQTMEYVADVEGTRDGWLYLTVKNRFLTGDRVEVLTPAGVRELIIREIRDGETGEALQAVSVAGKRVRVPCGFEAQAGDFVRGVNRNHLLPGEKP